MFGKASARPAGRMNSVSVSASVLSGNLGDHEWPEKVAVTSWANCTIIFAPNGNGVDDVHGHLPGAAALSTEL